MSEIETRLKEITEELRKEDCDIEALEKEVADLEQRRTELLANAEKRQATLEKLSKGAGETKENFEERKEIKNMEDNILATKEYRVAFLKQLQGKKLDETEERTLTTVANSAGASVPTSTMNEIVAKLYQSSALFNRVSVTNIAGNVKFAVSNAQTDASWKAEGADGSGGDDTLAEVILNGYELIKLVEISAAVSSMDIDAFEVYIVEQIANKMKAAIENAIVNGTGTGQPKGILTETLTDVKFTKAGMTYKDLTKVMAGLGTMYHNNAVFTMPRKLFFEEVLGMVDSTGKPVVVSDAQSPAKFRILGYEAIINDFMPNDTILFGDFSFYKFNFSKAIEVSSDASVGFKSGKITYRGLAVADGKTALTEAFVKSTRSAT